MPGKQDLEIPVYAFLGFLESGKTSFIQDTLDQDYFNSGERTLLIACEEGEEEYDEKLLEETNTTLVNVEDQEDFNRDLIIRLITHYDPERILIEYNGMWPVANLLAAMENTPLTLFQTIMTVDATTFDLYMNNMKSIAVEMYKLAELVIINRCTKDTPRAKYRRSIKAINRQVQVGFESSEDLGEEDDSVPFDIDGDEITLQDDEYGIWFIDAMERPQLYDGKTIHMKVRIFKAPKMPKGCFVPGRHAMTCCADDIQFLGYMCHLNHAKSSTVKKVENRMWADLTAQIKIEYNDEYKEEGPVLYATRIETAEKPDEELVYF